jgi:hypothetical protein
MTNTECSSTGTKAAPIDAPLRSHPCGARRVRSCPSRSARFLSRQHPHRQGWRAIINGHVQSDGLRAYQIFIARHAGLGITPVSCLTHTLPENSKKPVKNVRASPPASFWPSAASIRSKPAFAPSAPGSTKTCRPPTGSRPDPPPARPSRAALHRCQIRQISGKNARGV